ncbi:MAG: 50S ribosomal protein L35 [Planctomycetes bacterium]|jgi:large subunit ribosomal protein L35|nr:50S ribosomal protein L35 [Planctomycetota bacterium]HPY74385.1 50S ribosomal protein L35 [Planctomycetota bacterium]HQA99955.1 50S ribosomal protein L35 [Planctomycetota bacterium]HRU50876.1 50S ribosomal protein L35 [Planctomycetota bacterium]
MPKLKTNKSVAKRVRVTKTGKILRNKQGRRHLLSNKTSKRKRGLRKVVLIDRTQVKHYQEAIQS